MGKKNRNTQNRNNNVSTPLSSKSSTSKKSLAYSDTMEVKPYQHKNDTNDTDHKDKKKNKKHHRDNHKKPQIKKSKSSDINNHNKSQNRKQNRKERRNNMRNRQKSDPSLLPKYTTPTIVVPAKHSKTIQTSMILPKHNQTHPAISDPLQKHNYPPLKHNNNKKVHFSDTSTINKHQNNNKPNINVNLSVLSPPKHCISRTPTPTSTASLKNESVSTPKSMQSDNNDHQRTHPRPIRPPITRLQPKKDNNNNNMAP